MDIKIKKEILTLYLNNFGSNFLTQSRFRQPNPGQRFHEPNEKD
jgi:hypothetical protein